MLRTVLVLLVAVVLVLLLVLRRIERAIRNGRGRSNDKHQRPIDVLDEATTALRQEPRPPRHRRL